MSFLSFKRTKPVHSIGEFADQIYGSLKTISTTVNDLDARINALEEDRSRELRQSLDGVKSQAGTIGRELQTIRSEGQRILSAIERRLSSLEHNINNAPKTEPAPSKADIFIDKINRLFTEANANLEDEDHDEDFNEDGSEYR